MTDHDTLSRCRALLERWRVEASEGIFYDADLRHLHAAHADRREKDADELAAALGPEGERGFDLIAHLHRQRLFSEQTFGPGKRVEGVTDHIRKELVEVAESGGSLAEWVDVVLLALDGCWRSGAAPEQIVSALEAKQSKNESRKWPDWRTAQPGKAIEHERIEAPPQQPAPEPTYSCRECGVLQTKAEGGTTFTVCGKCWIRPQRPPAGKGWGMGDRSRGLYHKFEKITRTDGTSGPGRKHDGCDYFILDLTHDPHAAPALLAYIDSCRPDYPMLADDLLRKIIRGQVAEPAVPPAQPAPRAVCAICGKPATCFGATEDNPHGEHACSFRCGHGSEAGCQPIAPPPVGGQEVEHQPMGFNAPQWCATCSEGKPFREWVDWPCVFATQESAAPLPTGGTIEHEFIGMLDGRDRCMRDRCMNWEDPEACNRSVCTQPRAAHRERPR